MVRCLQMRLLRGLGGKVLPCGCTVGVYETYDTRTVVTIDVKGAACTHPRHRRHQPITEEPAGSFDKPRSVRRR